MVSNPRDSNFVPAIGVSDSVAGVETPVTGLAFSGREAALVAIADGSGNQITSLANQQYADGAARGTATGTLLMVDDSTNIQSLAGDTAGNAKVVGNAASAATDSGNPVKVGGKYNSSDIALTNGQRGDLQLTPKGWLKSQMFDQYGNGIDGSLLNADGASTSIVGLNASSYGLVYNGTTWDRLKGDTTGGSYVQVKGGPMPSGTSLNTYSVRLTTNTTTTPTSSTAYISSLVISSEVGGTTSTVTVQDKQGTPLKLVNGAVTTAITTTPTTLNFQTPIKMTSGIDIITAGAVAATVDVWINYYQ